MAKEWGEAAVNAVEFGLWKSSAHEERQSEWAGWGKDGGIYSLWFCDLFFFLLDSCKKFCSGHINLDSKFVFCQVKATSTLFSKLQYFFY